MKKTIIITAIVVVLTSVALMVFVRLTSGNKTQVLNFAEAKKGSFEISISSGSKVITPGSIRDGSSGTTNGF